jgi:hypothetical protein
MSVIDSKKSYEKVPNEGKPFEEDGKLCYWTFSNAKVGTVCRNSACAWRPLTRSLKHLREIFGEPKKDGEPQVIPGFGGKPVQFYSEPNPGFYYEINHDLECVAEEWVDGLRIAKWVERYPLDEATQQALAFAVSSKEEYTAARDALARQTLNGGAKPQFSTFASRYLEASNS